MRALLLVAHGSRRQESNREIASLTARLAERAADNYDIIDCAFLELADPDIPTGIRRCVQQGATSVRVLPYFLARGTHVAQDIPDEVQKAASEHPTVSISVSGYLGTSEDLVDLLLRLAA